MTIYQTISRILWVTRGSRALERVASGETDTIEGWLAYGAALNEGRGLFASDEQFGKWLVSVNLAHTDRHERAAAMWAAVWRCAGAVWRCRNLRQSVLASGCSGLASGGGVTKRYRLLLLLR